MLRVCTSSTETTLLSLESYKTAIGTTSTADDNKILAALTRATSLVEAYVGYPLRRQVYSESVAGYGGIELRVSRAPVLSIESVLYSTEIVDPTSYAIGDAEAGLVYREQGWPWTAGIEYDLTPRVVPKSELKSFTVTYEAGFCVNGSTADGWLTTGEPVPADIESALVTAATFLYKSAGRDPSVSSKRIGDLSITYQGSNQPGQGGSISVGLPLEAKGMLAKYVRF
jgi:hypothetical protein